MKPRLTQNHEQGLTLVELLILLTLLLILAAIILSQATHSRGRVLHVNCVNNLKQTGLATRIWEGDHDDKFPPQVSITSGGSMEFGTGPNMFRHLQVMSNELSTPKVVICPEETDPSRYFAANFQDFCNSNTSFFYGLNAAETQPASFLVGDRNLTNGLPLTDAVMDLTTNQSPRWTKELHKTYGNISFSDGSVQQVYATNLQKLLAVSGLATNRLQIPVLPP